MKKVIFVALCAIAVGIQNNSVQADDVENPFALGTGYSLLSPERIEDLRGFIQFTRVRLEQAKRDSEGLPVRQIHDILLAAAIEVVQQSHLSEPRKELLARTVLDQAIELVRGQIDATAAVVQPTVLTGLTNQDLLTQILQQSIDLALRYVAPDEAAVNAQSLADLPYVELANERLILAYQSWVPSVFEAELQFKMRFQILQQWFNTVNERDALHLATMADTVLRVDEYLRRMRLVTVSRENFRQLDTELRRLLLTIPVLAGPRAARVEERGERAEVLANTRVRIGDTVVRVDRRGQRRLVSVAFLGEMANGRLIVNDPVNGQMPLSNFYTTRGGCASESSPICVGGYHQRQSWVGGETVEIVGFPATLLGVDSLDEVLVRGTAYRQPDRNTYFTTSLSDLSANQALPNWQRSVL